MKVGGSTLVPPVGETLCESSLIGGCWVEWLFLHVRAVNRSVALVAFSNCSACVASSCIHLAWLKLPLGAVSSQRELNYGTF